MHAKLTEEEVREVLARAEAIHMESSATSDAHSVIRAAEEAGLPREAIEQAIRERFEFVGALPKPGELAFAKSTDGKFYVSEVIESAPTSARVRFLKGGELSVRPEDLKPLSLLPGQRVVCPWPDWGWWTCTVVSYNADKKKVKVSDGWGSTETFPISDVRLDPPRSRNASGPSRAKLTLYAYALGVLTGGVATGILTWLVMR